MSPGARFVVGRAPEWMALAESQKAVDKTHENSKFDPSTMGSSENIIATAFALMQTKEDDAEQTQHTRS